MLSECLISTATGCATGAGLIIAIGAQNAFVLKQGILKSHIFYVALLCALLDALLIIIGVGGFGKLINTLPYFLEITKYGGALFLFYYGLMAFKSAYKGENKINLNDEFHAPHLKQITLTLLVVTLLNPHTYLDTIVLLGSIAAQYEPLHRFFFGLGAIIASFIWFFSLAYGAQLLRPYFINSKAWRILDSIIALIMWGICATLLSQ